MNNQERENVHTRTGREERGNMYKYFVSYSYFTDNGTGFGNIVVESNYKITDYENIDGMQQWIIDMQKWIEEKNGYIKNVIVLNFILLN